MRLYEYRHKYPHHTPFTYTSSAQAYVNLPLPSKNLHPELPRINRTSAANPLQYRHPPTPADTVQHSYSYIILSTVLVNNFVLSQFLGLCPFMGVSRKIDTALGMGLATAFVLTLSAVSAYLLDTYLLEPFGLRYLRTIGFIVAIAVLVGLTEMFIAKTSPVLHRLLGVYLPLITTNCAVLGVALLNANQQHNLLQSALYGFGAAVGFTLVLIIFAALRERLDAADVPAPFKGTPAALMTAGILAIAFMGFGGWA